MASKIGVALIGCGRIGITHLRAIQELPEEIELVAVVDANTDILKKISKRYGPKKTYSSIENALKDPEIHAVILSLPNNQHCSASIEAAKSGKHVLVEKPMTLSVSEADLMIEASKKAGVNLMVAQSRRFIPALRLSKNYLSKIGKPFNMVYLTMGQYPVDIQNPPTWWRSRVCTGGLIFPNVGAHTLDYSLWLFDDRKPVSVYARSYCNNLHFEGEDEGVVIVEMDDGSLITNHISYNTSPAVRNCVINGPSGTMSFLLRYSENNWPLGHAEADLVVNGEVVFKDDGKEWDFVLQLKEFINSIRESREPLTSGEFGRKVVRAIEAAIESSRTKQIVKF